MFQWKDALSAARALSVRFTEAQVELELGLHPLPGTDPTLSQRHLSAVGRDSVTYFLIIFA